MEDKYTKKPTNILYNKYTKKPVQSKLVTIIMTMVLFAAVACTAIFAVLLSPTNLVGVGAGEESDFVISDWNENVRFMVAVADELGIKYKEKTIDSLSAELGKVDVSRFRTIVSLDLSGMQLKNVPPILEEFTGLTQLNLSNNFLFELPDFLVNNVNIHLNCENNLLNKELYEHQYELYILEVGQEKYNNMSFSKTYDPNYLADIARDSLWIKATTSYGTNTQGQLYDGAQFDIIYSNNVDGNNGTIDNYINMESNTIIRSGIVNGFFKIKGSPDSSSNLQIPFSLKLEADKQDVVDTSIWEDNAVFIDHMLKKFNLQSIDQLTKPMLSSITEIIINTPELTSIPKAIASMTNLERLDLSGSRVTKLPDMTSLTKLKEINISNTDIDYIDQSVLDLVNIQILDVSGNNFTDISPEIGGMTGLRELYLNDNQLTALPEDMSKLENLFKLNISNNNINPLPSWFTNYKNFILIAQNNGLSDIPQSYESMSMVYLDISGNNFSKIPEVLLTIDSLNTLIANDNQIVNSSNVRDGWSLTGNLLDSSFGDQRKLLLQSDDIDMEFSFQDIYNSEKILSAIVPNLKLSDSSDVLSDHMFGVIQENGEPMIDGQYVDKNGNILVNKDIKAYVTIIGATLPNSNVCIEITIHLESSVASHVESETENTSSIIDDENSSELISSTDTQSSDNISNSTSEDINNSQTNVSGSSTDPNINNSGVNSSLVSGVDMAERPFDHINEEIINGSGRIVKMSVTEPVVLDKEVFETLKETSKRLEVDVYVNEEFSYSWLFNADEVKEVKAIDLTIDTVSDNDLQIRDVAKENFVIALSFANNGSLPGSAEITVSLPNIFDKSKDYYIYFYNPDNGTAEYIDKLVVSGNTGTFKISHNSDYFISDSIISDAKYNPSNSWLTPINIALMMLVMVIIFTIITGIISFFPKKSFVTIMPTDKPYYQVYRQMSGSDNNDKNYLEYMPSVEKGSAWEDKYSYDFRPNKNSDPSYKSSEMWQERDEEIPNSEFLGESIIWCSDDSLNFNADNDFKYSDDDYDDYEGI